MCRTEVRKEKDRKCILVFLDKKEQRFAILENLQNY